MNELKKIIAAIKKRDLKSVYFLMGEEPFYIDLICNKVMEYAIPEEEKDFNQIVLYGKDTTINDIMAQARQFPFMGDRILIVVKEAQDLVKTIDQFADYFKALQQSTTIVFCYKYKTIDKRKALYRAIEKSEDAIVFESSKVKEYHLEGWIKQYVLDQGLTIEPKGVSMLAEFLGADLGKIANEIDKLKISLKGHHLITADLIETNIGISKEYNNFELISAIVEKNEAKAFAIAKYFSLNSKSNPMVVTTALLYTFFARLLQYHGQYFKNSGAQAADVAKHIGVNIYALRDFQTASKHYPMKKTSAIIGAIREIDMKGKGVNGTLSHEDLLKELLIKIFR